jgi:hypothetical protein
MSKDASLFANVIAKMTEYKSIAEEENGGYSLYKRVVSINFCMFAFLTIPLTPRGSECIVKVMHCTKECTLPMGQSVGKMDGAADQAIMFVQETQVQQLPKFLLQLTAGLEEAVSVGQVYVPSSDVIAALYVSQ